MGISFNIFTINKRPWLQFFVLLFQIASLLFCYTPWVPAVTETFAYTCQPYDFACEDTSVQQAHRVILSGPRLHQDDQSHLLVCHNPTEVAHRVKSGW